MTIQPITQPSLGISEALAATLRSTKAELASIGTAGEIHQTGAACVARDFPLPDLDQLSATALGDNKSDSESPEAIIDMFVVDGAGTITPTGSNEELNRWWQPAVESMSVLVLNSLAQHGIAVRGPTYVTASLTPTALIEGKAHFDDDMFMPGDGVGAVAIVGDIDGPRIACAPIRVDCPPAGAPLTLSDTIVEEFAAGQIAHQQARPESVTIFAQFGQLHAGPALADCSSAAAARIPSLRRLLVLRAATEPTNQPG